jgi:8-oxo-dGTP pyrophosphatase MutT (NUDIX family)
MSINNPHPHLAQWLSSVQSPPRGLRWPLHCMGRIVGSVEPSVAAALLAVLGRADRSSILQIKELPTQIYKALEIVFVQNKESTLAQLADTLLRIGRCGPWRNERLPVTDENGHCWASVERGAVRVLGMRSQAVHLVGMRPDGHIWVQQRSFHKPNDPGLWDTLMGGTVAAGETLGQTLVRETWEEAGLRWAQLPPAVWGGQFTATRPVPDGNGAGYLVEDTHWYTVIIPNGLVPQNQDGEVDHFECWSPTQVLSALHADRFTPEARWVLAQVLQV